MNNSSKLTVLLSVKPINGAEEELDSLGENVVIFKKFFTNIFGAVRKAPG
ncbi:MAG: hypothetical protein QE263_00470 [Vampirovibrionales bacterium]|nr:hypothetical protein [Vampirovibrionales bacterium]